MANSWIDLSRYGLTLMVGVIDPPTPPLPGRILILDGRADGHEDALRGLGFEMAGFWGRWVHVGAPPGSGDILAAFPEARVIENADMRRYAVRLKRNAAPAPLAVASADLATPAAPSVPVDTPSPRTPVPEARPPFAVEAAAPSLAEAASDALVPGRGARNDLFSSSLPVEAPRPLAVGDVLEDVAKTSRDADAPQGGPFWEMTRTSRQLGRNRAGQSVYQNERGRFIQDARGRALFEGSNAALAPGLFLRATDGAQLAVAADGFVREMGEGSVQRFQDLKRFASAAYDQEIDDTDPRLVDAHQAIEASMSRFVARKAGRVIDDLWNGSKKIQEAAAWTGDLSRRVPDVAAPLPRPIVVALQRVLGTDLELQGKRVASVGGGLPFAHMPKGVDLRVHTDRATADVRATLAAIGHSVDSLSDAPPDLAAADFVVANLEHGLLETPRTYEGGFVVRRSDVAEALDGLLARGERTETLLMFRGGGSPEDRDELERARHWIGARFGILGTVNIDGALHDGRPENDPLRVVAVGPRRPVAFDEAPARSLQQTDASEWSALWTWSAQMAYARAKVAEHFKEISARTADALGGEANPELEENHFQAPYVSLSAIGQASTMVPRNLEGATREALARIARRHEDVDQWVADELGMTKTQLERFSPEQVDVLAMTFDADERGRAFLNCDQTGIGKGRWIAGVARRAALMGKQVLLVTEKEINISDSWRDIRHIGADADFSPLILNDGAQVVDEETGDVTMTAPHRDYTSAVTGTGAWPENHNLVIATYSQFNKPGAAPAPRRMRNPPGPGATPEAVAAFEASEAAATEAHAAAVARISPKSAWVRAAVDDNTVVILDECHNAAGDSNIAENIAAALGNAGQIIFSSATWAKNAKNMGIYAPLFPPGFDTENLADVMRKGGESMQETLSSMLVKDGVMIRREHDLSKCEFTPLPDEARRDRNREYMDLLAPVLAEMAYLSGDLERKVSDQNKAVERALREEHGGGDDVDAVVRKKMRSLQTNRIGFGSPLYNLSRLFICSLLVDKSAEEAVQALRTGRKPVVLLENTVQALMDGLRAERDGDLDGAAAPDFKDLVRRVLGQLTKVSRKRHGVRVVEDLAEGAPEDAVSHDLAAATLALLPPALLAADEADEEPLGDWRVAANAATLTAAEAMLDVPGVEGAHVAEAMRRMRAVFDALPDDASVAASSLRRLDHLLPDDPARVVRRINDLIDRLPDLPVSAIDAVRDRVEAEGRRLHEAGEIERPWVVEEITGRSLQVRDGMIRRRPPVRKVDVKNRFNSGATDCVIINTSGATGIDLHAGRRFRDQRQRVLIEQQSPADITKQIQAYGRVIRFDQVIGARIVTLMAGLPMEQRLIAMRNAKLRRLSANITSNREHSALVENVLDLMNPVGDTVCTRYAEARPDLMRLLGFSVERNAVNEDQNQADEGGGEDQKDTHRSANEFLARLVMLPVGRQEQVIEELEAEYRATIQELDARGENPLKSRTIEGTVHLRERVVFQGADVENPDSEFERPVFAQTVYVEHAIEPVRADDVADAIERGTIDSGADSIEDCANQLERAKNRVLQTYLPMEVGVAQALAAGNNRVLNAMNQSMERLIGVLREIRPGCSVKVTLDGVVEEALVTAVHLPDRRRLHLASNYDIALVAPGWIKGQRLSLKSLLSDEAFEIGEGVLGDGADAMLRAFDDAREGARLEKRVILTGNQWTAMSLSVKNKLGSMTGWQDEQGIRHRGVLVSKRHRDLNFVPIVMPSARMAAAALISRGCEVFGSSDFAKTGIVAKRSDDHTHVLISLPSKRSKKYGGIYEHEPIGRLVTRLNTAAAGKNPVLRVAEHDLELVLGHLMRGGASMFITSNNRAWTNEWLAAEAREREPVPDEAAPVEVAPAPRRRAA